MYYCFCCCSSQITLIFFWTTSTYCTGSILRMLLYITVDESQMQQLCLFHNHSCDQYAVRVSFHLLPLHIFSAFWQPRGQWKSLVREFLMCLKSMLNLIFGVFKRFWTSHWCFDNTGHHYMTMRIKSTIFMHWFRRRGEIIFFRKMGTISRNESRSGNAESTLDI